MLKQLINEAENYAWGVIQTELYRSEETSKQYKKEGKGIHPSLHNICLACDIYFVNSMWEIIEHDFTSIEWLGEYWEGLGGNWGGRFNDGPHFSLSYPYGKYRNLK